MSHKTISVVIPTFTAQKLLAENLPSVEKLLRPEDELIIADDASTDDTVEWLKNRYHLTTARSDADKTYLKGATDNRASVQVVVNRHNARFAVTANRGVRAATKDLILLLNNDVKPEAGICEVVAPYFDDTLMFAVGCHELEKNGSEVISGGKKKLWFGQGLFQHSRSIEFSTGATDWVSGGSSFFDRQKWLELGGFDPAFYPAYWEDVDLSYRAKQKGWKLWFEAKAIVHHNHESTNQTVFGQLTIDDMSWKNGQTFLWKHASGLQIPEALIWSPIWWWRRYQSRQKLLKRV